jgi:hypothetical protein
MSVGETDLDKAQRELDRINKEINNFLFTVPGRYIANMRQPGVFAEDTEIQQLFLISEHNICFYNRDGDVYRKIGAGMETNDPQKQKVHMLFGTNHFVTLQVNGQFITDNNQPTETTTFQEVETRGDGNCLFNAYVQARDQKKYDYLNNGEEKAQQEQEANKIRQQVCDALEKDWHDCSNGFKTLQDNEIYVKYQTMINGAEDRDFQKFKGIVYGDDSAELQELRKETLKLREQKIAAENKIRALKSKPVAPILVAADKVLKPPVPTPTVSFPEISHLENYEVNLERVFPRAGKAAFYEKHSEEERNKPNSQQLGKIISKESNEILINVEKTLLDLPQWQDDKFNREQIDALVKLLQTLVKVRASNGTTEPLLVDIYECNFTRDYLEHFYSKIENLKLPIKMIDSSEPSVKKSKFH